MLLNDGWRCEEVAAGLIVDDITLCRWHACFWRTKPCIAPKSNRTVSITYDAKLYRQRSKIEIMFGRFKDLAASLCNVTDVLERYSRTFVFPHLLSSDYDQ